MYDELKRRFDFAGWQGITTLPLHLLLWRYRMRGTELPGWEIRSARALVLPQAGRFLPSVWQHSGAVHGEAVRLDAYECASRDAAHETVIRLLGEFTAPVVRRLTDLELGDVAFGPAEQGRAVLFARANLVFLVATAGALQGSVVPLAQSLDRDVVSKPPTVARARAAPPAAGAQRVVLGTSLPIELETAIAQSRRDLTRPLAVEESAEPQHKLFSRGCELFAEQGTVRAAPIQTGRQDVEVYTLAPGAAWQRRDIAIDAVKA